MHNSQHMFSVDDVTILFCEVQWIQRGVKEAVYIMVVKPSLSKD